MEYIVKAIIPIIIFVIITYGVSKGVKVYECFIEGAKEGIGICIKIFPYLLAMIIAVGVFRESGALNYFISLIKPVVKVIGLPPEVVPLVLIKPLSGSGALGVFAETLKEFGPDSYIGRISSIIMGSTETIFYTITVYFGAVGIKKIRHTLWAAVMADIASVIAAVTITRIMF
ncbi:spore maturation protein [Clostridium sp. MT-14]|uniref:Spore maturation protein n=1 Tax=Clostridium aromativorans TaxID=2836848 RepID=A0ABS8N1R7_9CLOT|nr:MULTISPECIES: spore maturation protein [Clostridium]KAA8671992.1 spore maturation protein [Clostridium sp. HV4-5-A1G]MCC9293741.1 spore maturation protein [Clostridium aromativorans]CAB1254311.1 spore maturation protein [Clostridiaceae bacterium BL-3]